MSSSTPGPTARTAHEPISHAWRSLIALALLAVLAPLAAGCASAPATDSRTGGGTSTTRVASERDQAVRFAECMRSNGVRAFPDPDASGELTIDGIANRSGVDPSTAAFTQALQVCQDLQPAGFTGHRRDESQQADALEFARCIRENGVKDFPDPDPDGPLVDTNRIPSLATSDDLTVLNAAMRTCHDLVASALGDR